MSAGTVDRWRWTENHRTECQIDRVCCFLHIIDFSLFFIIWLFTHTHRRKILADSEKSKILSLTQTHVLLPDDGGKSPPKFAENCEHVLGASEWELFLSASFSRELFLSRSCWTLSTIFHKFSHPLSQPNSRTHKKEEKKRKKKVHPKEEKFSSSVRGN